MFYAFPHKTNNREMKGNKEREKCRETSNRGPWSDSDPLLAP